MNRKGLRLISDASNGHRKLATDSSGTSNVKLGTSSKSWEDSMSFFHFEACGRMKKRTPMGELRLKGQVLKLTENTLMNSDVKPAKLKQSATLQTSAGKAEEA